MTCRSLAALGMIVVAAASAGAQCPDGSPPPCAGQRVAVAGRPANPPLDDRTWIVMPFDNLSNSSEIEWLKAASANLLYLDMSRWQDIRVVDDERVADFLREAPAAQNQPLSLASALSIARRAGAGKLVMGDVIKSGNRTMLTAKIFDVRNGQRTNTVRDETTVADSVIPLFGRLARRILKVDPPAGSSVGMVGTTSVAAYQAYSSGVQALNRFDIAAAKENLRRALQLDSTFALAHYKLATTLGWFEGADPRRREHAEASWRFASSLPARERRLIEAQLWHIRLDLVRARQLYAAAVNADSSDVEAWHGLGETEYHDEPVVRDSSDPTRVRFRGNWNLAARAFEKVLGLDPSYHVAYPHLVDMLEASQRRACLIDGEGRCVADYVAIARLSGDTMVFSTPLRLGEDSAEIRRQTEEYVRQGGRRRALLRADTVSMRWLSVGSAEMYAPLDRAGTLGQLGRSAEALELLAHARPTGSLEINTFLLMERLTTALKASNFKEARRIYDSARMVPAESQPRLRFNDGTVTSITVGEWLGRFLGWTFGHFAAAEPNLRGSGRTAPAPTVLRYRRAFARMMAGFPDSVGAAEAVQFSDASARLGAPNATRNIAATLAFGLNAPRQSWPAIDTSLRDARLRPIIAKLKNDRAGLRAAARMFDSTSRAITAAYLPDTAMSLVAVEAYLAAGDSLPALGVLRYALDSALARADLSTPISASGTTQYSVVLPRLMLQRADLAAALGERAEARLWYGRFLDLWSNVDPEVQPIAARVRRSLAALGGT